MGTPAFIGVKNAESGGITGVSCYNADVAGLGCRLIEHYHDESKARELINLGNLSRVGETIDDKRTSAYIRDWNRSAHQNGKKVYESMIALNGKKVYESMIALVEKTSYYMYFIFTDGGWHVSTDGRWVHLLHDALVQMDVIYPVSTVCSCASCR